MAGNTISDKSSVSGMETTGPTPGPRLRNADVCNIEVEVNEVKSALMQKAMDDIERKHAGQVKKQSIELADKIVAQARADGSTRLDLHGFALESVPKSIFGAQWKGSWKGNLTVLILAHNELTEVPPSIKKLKSLVSLNLSFNHIQELPEELMACTRLQDLNVCSNALVRLPHNMAALRNSLQRLRLANNPVDFGVPTLRPCVCIEELDLSCMYRRSLASWIGEATPDHMEKMRDIPDFVFRFFRLKVLDLSHNSLEFVSKDILLLSHLHTLNLAGNLLRIIPPGFVMMRSMTSLDLSHNAINDVPTEVATMAARQLRILLLDDNPLTNLPEQIRASPSDLNMLKKYLDNPFDFFHEVVPDGAAKRHTIPLHLIPVVMRAAQKFKRLRGDHSPLGGRAPAAMNLDEEEVARLVRIQDMLKRIDDCEHAAIVQQRNEGHLTLPVAPLLAAGWSKSDVYRANALLDRETMPVDTEGNAIAPMTPPVDLRPASPPVHRKEGTPPNSLTTHQTDAAHHLRAEAGNLDNLGFSSSVLHRRDDVHTPPSNAHQERRLHTPPSNAHREGRARLLTSEPPRRSSARRPTGSPRTPESTRRETPDLALSARVLERSKSRGNRDSPLSKMLQHMSLEEAFQSEFATRLPP